MSWLSGQSSWEPAALIMAHELSRHVCVCGDFSTQYPFIDFASANNIHTLLVGRVCHHPCSVSFDVDEASVRFMN